MSKISDMPVVTALVSTQILQVVDTAKSDATANEQISVEDFGRNIVGGAYLFGASTSGDLTVTATATTVGDWEIAGSSGQGAIVPNVNGTFTVSVTGVYKVETSLVFGAGGTTGEDFFTELGVNGSNVSIISTMFYSSNKQSAISLNGTAFYSATAGDSLSMMVGVTAGTSSTPVLNSFVQVTRIA